MKEIAISEIHDFYIGNAQYEAGGTGCTVISCPLGAAGGVDVRGGGPATRDTDLLNPVKSVEIVHALILSGGSAYGLGAAQGVMEYLEERRIGFDVGGHVVPIVPGACLFDLWVGDAKCRPDAKLGYQAMVNAEKNNPQSGNVGAGTGCSVGTLLDINRAMKSGLGIYAAQWGDLKVGAVVAVNSIGNVYDPEKGEYLAGLLSPDGTHIVSAEAEMMSALNKEKQELTTNTTLCCVITNANLSKVKANTVAMMAHDAYARMIRPVHTSLDGDAVFTLARGDVEVDSDIVGIAATEVVAEAIRRAAIVPSAYGYKGKLDL